MPTDDIRPCPFCAHDAPTLVAMGGDEIKRVSVVCTECGTVGPLKIADDPPGHAEYLRNQRYGGQLREHTLGRRDSRSGWSRTQNTRHAEMGF
jgi:hypothetical protein